MSDSSISVVVSRLAARSSGRTEADIQSDIKMLLTSGALDLDDADLDLDPDRVFLEAPAGDGSRRRIDIETGFTLIEVKKRLGPITEAEETQLAGYLATRTEQTDSTYAGILTDGQIWRLYRLGDEPGTLVEVDGHRADRSDPDVTDRLTAWLETVMATKQKVLPTPTEITLRLGAESAGYLFDLGQIKDLYARLSGHSEIALKRSLWAKSLSSAFGTQFEDTDELFYGHTYLVAVAELVAHAAIGFDLATTDAADLLDGTKFHASGIRGVVESDFFDWIVQGDSDETRELGVRIVRSLARRVTRFDWDSVDHDVLKALYESVITPEVRHSLGEYYTPDWLAGQIVERVVTQPLTQRVLDPSCGSGTFVYQTIRHKLAAANATEMGPRDRFDMILSTVTGMDLHPVAVTLARITYLLAIMDILADRPPEGFVIPVFLGDSVQWGRTDDDNTLLGSAGLRVTTEGAELVEREMVFPTDTLVDADRFDALVDDLVGKATNRDRGSTRPTVGTRFFSKHAIENEDSQDSIRYAYDVLCDLHDQHLDHIWGYYIRNLARPLWLSVPDNQVDVMVGNPPWLRYNAMPRSMQDRFKARGNALEVRPKGTLATHADLSALFVVTALDLYLRTGGTFGFVMPRGVLGGPHYKEFRTGAYPQDRGPYASFDQPWDLGLVRPHLFPVPACVAFGTKTAGAGRPLPASALSWIGSINPNARPEEAATALDTTVVPIVNADDGPQSPYHDEVRNGANLYPRMLVMVDRAEAGPIPPVAGTQPVKSRKRTLDKEPWKQVSPMSGEIEAQFVKSCYLGSCVAPFLALQPELAIVPWNDTKLLTMNDGQAFRAYPGLRNWWDKAHDLWNRHASGRMTLDEQIDHQGKLTAQFPIAPIRVVYASSGTRMAAAVLQDPDAIIENSLYYWRSETLGEAHYLTAILNTETLVDQFAPLQPQGQFGRRHIHRYPFYPHIPRFDPALPTHVTLVDLAERAEQLASNVDRTGSFQTVRRAVRETLARDGVDDELEEAASIVLFESAGAVGSLPTAPGARP